MILFVDFTIMHSENKYKCKKCFESELCVNCINAEDCQICYTYKNGHKSLWMNGKLNKRSYFMPILIVYGKKGDKEFYDMLKNSSD